MYRELLYDAGGGIIGDKQKAEPAKCATLAIGLGGMGIDCLRRLKRRVYESLRPDNPGDLIQSYSHIRFLAVDSDRSSMTDDGKINPLDERTEFFDISMLVNPFLPAPFLELLQKPEFGWFDLDIVNYIVPGQRTARANGIRQIGRMLLMNKSDAFVNKLASLIMEAKSSLPREAGVNVCIFSGLCGGTGSGTFLDVCYLVQKAAELVGEKDRCRISGFFFLPDVYLSIPSIANDQTLCSVLQLNGYAAMKELDYCMSFETNGGKWDQIYRGFSVGPTQSAPVHACHLISSVAMDGNRVGNGYDHAISTAGDLVMQFLIRNELDIDGYIDRSNGWQKVYEREHGANYRYIVLGSSEAAVPVREISTYLGSKLFAAFSVSRSKYPKAEEVEEIARVNGFDFEGLTRLAMSSQPLNGSVPQSEDIGKTVIRRLFEALEEAVADPGRGPFYAAAVLGGEKGKNLVNILEESLERSRREIETLSGERLLLQEDVRAAREAYLHPRLFQSRKRLLHALNEKEYEYSCLERKIELLHRMRNMIPELIDQFRALFNTRFRLFCSVYSEILDTFEENCRAISGGAIELNDSFTMHVPELNAKTTELLDQMVGNLDFDLEMSRFNRAFFRAEDAWLRGDANRIARFVSDYASGYYGTESCKKAYQLATGIKGIHIYEGTERDSRDWRDLPDLVPFSVAGIPTKEML